VGLELNQFLHVTLILAPSMAPQCLPSKTFEALSAGLCLSILPQQTTGIC
jgi:hypothetical protein